MIMNRRRFLRTTSSAVALGALSSKATGAFAQSSDLKVVVSGGNFGKAMIEAFVKPFEAETGIGVSPITQDVLGAQVAMMVKTNSVTVDVVILNQSGALDLATNGYLENIDYSIFNKQELDAIFDYCKQPFGVAAYIYSLNMVYNTKKFPAGSPRPANWAEFWDVKKFPGTRTFPDGATGNQGPWEEALLADGVPADALYPMDIDRVFASLDKIRPHIRKWWASGAEVLQIMRDNVADIGESYDGRAVSLIEAGSPIEINRNQAKLTWDYFFIPKGSPNVKNAQRFIEFTTRAERQAAFAQLYPEGPTNRNAYKTISETVARRLPTYPEYMAQSITTNAKWYNEVGSDGLTNRQRLAERWKEWILR
ncbi:ABC transporter substrate-binding protein [Bradyrhizobium sp. 30]|uniref:ABC transporter substrate-binding protein n=1 Tax=Bradyrhizobium sp. 30 TaxID=2782669 RepID=UPI001FFAA9DA|nr:ABC transporter substrate-binding protein [Bradyrhizobium sp. 30]MCK1293181.1 ABC transporter substrate-binding protein [Bradyrhizobium sp. 30]